MTNNNSETSFCKDNSEETMKWVGTVDKRYEYVCAFFDTLMKDNKYVTYIFLALHTLWCIAIKRRSFARADFQLKRLKIAWLNCISNNLNVYYNDFKIYGIVIFSWLL